MRGDNGSPCLTLLAQAKKPYCLPLTEMERMPYLRVEEIKLQKISQKPKDLRTFNIKF